MKTHLIPVLCCAGLLYAGTLAAVTEVAPLQPESGFGLQDKTVSRASQFMVAAAHPAAAEAGYESLERGGTAMDAAVATQMVLNLVEPQSSGIGGGAFLVYWDAGEQALYSFDGRETAPQGISPERFLGPDGEPLPWWERITGGGSVGVPGTLKLLETAHSRFGRQPFGDLLEPAIQLARNGFVVSPRLSDSIEGAAEHGLKKFDAAREYFFDAEGNALQAGATLTNPAFADTLELIAREGSRPFYHGAIARDIVDTINLSRPNSIALEDLSNYRVVERPPVCAPFRRYQVCGMGPPSSGALTVGQILGIMAQIDTPGGELDSLTVHRFAEAGKLAYADRALYMADSDYVDVPIAGLLDPGYLAQRASAISDELAMPEAEAGSPPLLSAATRLSPDASTELPGTSHISIIDRYGNALSMTTTIESGFGSRLMTRGFLLNNELTDFSPYPAKDGEPIANRIEPGKRPRSSMAPTIVFDAEGRPVLVVGSPGGSRIINYVAKTIFAVLDTGLNVQDAVSLPHFGNRNGATELEEGTDAERFRENLEAAGHEIRTSNMNSGLHAILITPEGELLGGADPRREGVALGD